MAKVDPLRTRGVAGAGAAQPRKAARGSASSGRTPPSAPVNVLPLIEQIDEQGEELAKDPTGTALERYKRSVRSLLDTAVAECMQLQSEAALGFTRRVFSTIARVDLALSELTDAVLKRQHDVLKIKGLVDQVKGLLIDLYR